MSGIPLRPAKWATAEINYPAGGNPWNGQPVIVAPAGDIFTPNTGVAAEELNYTLNKATGGSADAQDLAISAALNNWTAPQTAAGLAAGYVFRDAMWDASLNAWVWFARNAVTATNVYRSWNGRDFWQWAAVASDAAACGGAHGGAVFFLSSATSGGHNATYINSSGTVTHPSLSGISSTDVGVVDWFANANCWIIYNVQGFGATSTSALFASPDGATFASPTIPAAWTSSTNHAGTNPGTVFGAQSATTFLLAYGGVTAGTDTSRLGQITGSAYNALTFTDITPAVCTGKVITGLAYSANDGLWGLLVADGVGAGRLYTSPDLVNWNLVHLFGTVFPVGLAVVGSVWAVGVAYTWNGGTVARTLISSDVATLGASSTWHFTAGGFPGVTQAEVLKTSGNQLLAFTTDGAQTSLSQLVGLL